MPMPPPTRSGRSTSSSNPLPRGPKTWIASPADNAHSARVPGPIASIRNVSSPVGAWQRLNGRGSTHPGASSMKNCPGMPGSSPPRASCRSVYAPISSAPITAKRSRRTPSNSVLLGVRLPSSRLVSNSGLDPDSLLEREGGLGAGVRDRVHRGRRARDGGDAGDARRNGGFPDPIAVCERPRPLGRVHDQVATVIVDQIDDGLLVVMRIGDLGDLLHLEPCRAQ